MQTQQIQIIFYWRISMIIFSELNLEKKNEFILS